MVKFFVSNLLTDISIGGATVGDRGVTDDLGNLVGFDTVPGALDELEGKQITVSLERSNFQDLRWSIPSIEQGKDSNAAVAAFVAAFRAMLNKDKGGRWAIQKQFESTEILRDIGVAAYENKLPAYYFNKNKLSTVFKDVNVDDMADDHPDHVKTLFNKAQIEDIYFSLLASGGERVITSDSEYYVAGSTTWQIEDGNFGVGDYIAVKVHVATAEIKVAGSLCIPELTDDHELTNPGTVKFYMGFKLVGDGVGETGNGLLEVVDSTVPFVRTSPTVPE